MHTRFVRVAVCLALLVSWSAASLVAAEELVDEHARVFGRYEAYSGPTYDGVSTDALYVPMRDGVKIALDVSLPSDLPDGVQVPAILSVTRYWRARAGEGPTEQTRFFTRHGYAVVQADARGSGASYGVRPSPWSRAEVDDIGEVAAWIASQPWSDGTVGTIGTSYVGTTAELAGVSNQPAIKALIPRFMQFDFFSDTAFPGGVLNRWMIKNWAGMVRMLDNNRLVGPDGQPISGVGVKPVDADTDGSMLAGAVKEHQANIDVYRAALSGMYRDDPFATDGLSTDQLSVPAYRSDIERSGAAIYNWGSWFDGSTADAVIGHFLAFENPQRVVIGPWSHGGGHHTSPYLPGDTPTDPSVPAQWLECLRFFDHHLRGVDTEIADKRLAYYTMGEEKWKSTSVWPPAGASRQNWYFTEDHGLSPTAPQSQEGDDRYTIDFKATTGRKNRWHTQLGGPDVIYPNRAEADRRLLTYTSQPVAEDMEITGHPVVHLYVTSSASDGAFFVYLEDVAPDGRVRYITEGQLRAIHRKVSNNPPPYRALVPYHTHKRGDSMPLVPGQMAELSFGLLPTSVLIKKGHRVRIAIAGADKDTFARIPEEATPTITVARNSARASRVELPVVDR